MIKIAFVETNCKKTGPIKQTLYIIEHLDRKIFKPYLVTIWDEETNNSMIDEYKKKGVPCLCCNLTKNNSVIFGKHRVKKILKEIEPDIIQAVGMPPYRMTLGYKEAIHFTTLRNYCYEDYPDQYTKIIGMFLAFFDVSLIKKQLRRGLSFVTCSKSLTMIYEEREKIKLPFIRNGVDISQYRKREEGEKEKARRKLGISLNAFVFIYSGGLIDRKNQREAIEAFKRIQKKKEAFLLLLGDGKDKNELLKKYETEKNILFLGKVDNVRDYLVASDVYVSTSKSEGLPNGVLEAMSVGVPVILSNISQHLEVLRAGEVCGLSYTLFDIDELKRCMEIMMNNESLMTYENNCVSTINQCFTAQIMSKNYQEKYLELIKHE